MSADPTRISVLVDPTQQRMTGRTYHGYKWFDVPFMTEIARNLWQGGCEDGLTLPPFISHVVSLYKWASYDVFHELDSSLTVKAYDSPDQSTDMIDGLADWVNHCRESGPVLVHCQAGLNRSSLVVARALMRGDGMTAEGAIGLIREKRSDACLCNESFESWLLKA